MTPSGTCAREFSAFWLDPLRQMPLSYCQTLQGVFDPNCLTTKNDTDCFRNPASVRRRFT
jgi:hypothetical protein